MPEGLPVLTGRSLAVQLAVALPALLLAVASLAWRFVRLDPGQSRQQVKWVMLGFAGFIACGMLLALLMLADGEDPGEGSRNDQQRPTGHEPAGGKRRQSQRDARDRDDAEAVVDRRAESRVRDKVGDIARRYGKQSEGKKRRYRIACPAAEQ